MSKDRLAVAFSCDNNYSKIMTVAIISLLENNKCFSEIIIYWLMYNVGTEAKKQVEEIVKNYGRKIVCIDINPFCERYRFWEKKEDSRYVRLILSEIVDEDYLLYLDCDVLVASDLLYFSKLNIDDYSQAAVLDTAREDARKEAHISSNDNYFNSGVLYINLKYWRKNNVIEKFKKFKSENCTKGIYRDQRVINGVLSKTTFRIEPKYNYTPEFLKYSAKQLTFLTGAIGYYTQNELNEAKSNPCIVHFAGRSIDRPWFDNSEHPLTTQYRKYMNLYDFTNFPLCQDKFEKRINWKIRKILPSWIYIYLNRLRHRK